MLCQACPVILAPSSTEHPPTALPLHYPLAAGCVLIFVLDLWRHQSAVFSPRTFLEHFATCFVLLPTPPRYGGTTPGPASGPPSRATRCPSTHPILVYCVLCSAVYPALLCSALPCRTFSLNLFHLTLSHFHPSQACSHSRSSTLEQCSCWHFEQ